MIRILSGHGRYADPWHPFAETSAGIASVVGEIGLEHEVVDVSPDTLGDLAGIDLLVVNTGGGGRDAVFADTPAWTAAFASAEEWIRSGGRLLATHQATNGFPDWAAYRQLLGGFWQPGVSMHPPRGDARFTPVPGRAGDPLLAGLAEVTAHDERYSKLVLGDDVETVLEHDLDGEPQPVVWRRRTDGLRIIVDALGHDAESYRSPTRRLLFANEVRELLLP